MHEKSKPVCVYCAEPADTRDHVPPKSFFPEPRPNDLITVPCCNCCNGSYGRDEEWFRATYMFGPAGVSSAGKKLWKQKIDRSYKRPQGIRSLIAQQISTKSPVLTPAGLYLGHRMTIQAEQKRSNRVIEKVTRGLSYFEFGSRLDTRTEIICGQPKTKEDFRAAASVASELAMGSRGWPGVFQYVVNRSPHNSEVSIWYAEFWGTETFFSSTGDLEQYDKQPSD